jgi:hypothetical protein
VAQHQQDHAGQAGDAGGGLEVADVGLDRAEAALPAGVGRLRPKAWWRPAISIGSPRAVPVPWAST